MGWFWKRFSEPSTYAGLGVTTLGLGELFKINEAPAVGEVLSQGAQAVAAGASPMMAGILIISGILGVFFGEKGKR